MAGRGPRLWQGLGVNLPTGPADITASWLADRLGVPVGSLSHARIGEGFGLDATLARFWWPGGSVVVKWATASNGRSEQAFYEGCGRRLRGPQLGFLGAWHDDQLDRSVLLLEDRCDLEAGDLIVGATDVRARALVEVASEWHALFWGDPDAAVRSWCEGRDDWMERVLPHVPEFLAGGLPVTAAVRAALESMPADLAGHFGVLCTGPQTLVHGDLHLDNVLFDGDVPIVIDWPGHRRGSAAIDLVRLLVETLRVEDRRRLQPDLLDLWLRCMEAGGVRVEPDWLEASLRSAAVWLVVATTGWYTADPEPTHPRIAPLRDTVMTRGLALLDELISPARCR